MKQSFGQLNSTPVSLNQQSGQPTFAFFLGFLQLAFSFRVRISSIFKGSRFQGSPFGQSMDWGSVFCPPPTRGLLVIVIEQRQSLVFLSFFFPNKYFFDLHLLPLLLPFLSDYLGDTKTISPFALKGHGSIACVADETKPRYIPSADRQLVPPPACYQGFL